AHPDVDRLVTAPGMELVVQVLWGPRRVQLDRALPDHLALPLPGDLVLGDRNELRTVGRQHGTLLLVNLELPGALKLREFLLPCLRLIALLLGSGDGAG